MTESELTGFQINFTDGRPPVKLAGEELHQLGLSFQSIRDCKKTWPETQQEIAAAIGLALPESIATIVYQA